MIEKDYLDAKFDGLEKLMALSESNLKNYISAVSSNVKSVSKDLAEHKEKVDAHGLGEGRRATDSIAKWGSLVLAAVALLLGIKKGH